MTIFCTGMLLTTYELILGGQYLGGFDPHTLGIFSADKKFHIWGRPHDDTSVHFEVQPIFIYIYILHS